MYAILCLFEGQTGSGKTYSMFGYDDDGGRGLIPRSVEYIFEQLKVKSENFEVAMVCSFLEIYNDQIRDLGKAYLMAMGVQSSNQTVLNEKTSDIFERVAGKRGNSFYNDVFHTKPRNTTVNSNAIDMPGIRDVIEGYKTMNYEIREDSDGNVFVKDLSMIPVTAIDEVMSIISMGLRVRATHETKMNSTSSRSHTVFSINVVQRDKKTLNSISGNLNLIDLAGSERLKKSESQGMRLKEALHINSSLTCLGKVIMALDPSADRNHIPYRESKLTRLLQNSLGGNSYTSVLAAIHPHVSHYEECLSTLQFANRCRIIKNNPKVNYVFDVEDKDRRIKRLIEEITQLKARINQLEFLLNKYTNKEYFLSKLKKVFDLLNIDVRFDKNGNLFYNGEMYDITHIIAADIDDSPVGGKKIVSPSGRTGSDFFNRSNSNLTRRGSQSYNDIVNEHKLSDQSNQIIDSLKLELSESSAKNREKKLVIDEQSKQITSLMNEIERLKSSLQTQRYDHNIALNQKDLELNEYKKYTSKVRSDEINNILEQNKEVVNTQVAIVENIPATLKKYSALFNTIRNKTNNVSSLLQTEFEAHVLAFAKDHEKEINQITSQYSYFIREKDKALNEYISKFNQFREKKSTQLQVCEKQIVLLYQYIDKLEYILNKAESGNYLVKQHQIQQLVDAEKTKYLGYDESAIQKSISLTGQLLATQTFHNTIGMTRRSVDSNVDSSFINTGINAKSGAAAGTIGAVLLPKALKPYSVLKPKEYDELAVSRKIYQKYLETVAHLNKLKESNFRKAILTAEGTASDNLISLEALGDDPMLIEQIGEFIDIKPFKQTHQLQRPKTATGLDRSNRVLITNNVSVTTNNIAIEKNDSMLSQSSSIDNTKSSARPVTAASVSVTSRRSLSPIDSKLLSHSYSNELANTQKRIQLLERENEEYLEKLQLQEVESMNRPYF